MIKEVLRLIKDAGIVNTAEIAETIGTSPSMVQQAITTLQTKGYLSLVNSNHSCSESHCASCGQCKTTAHSSQCTYVVTDKGKKYLLSS
jgi:predicted transcriptional regulator